jgi:hypothetical protein
MKGDLEVGIDPAEIVDEILHPSSAIPVTPLQQQAFAQREAVLEAFIQAKCEMLQAIGKHARATRSAKTTSATNGRQQKAAERHAAIKAALAVETVKPAHKGKTTYIDRAVAKQFRVGIRTVQRVRLAVASE